VQRHTGLPDYRGLDLAETDSSVLIQQEVEQGFIFDGDCLIRRLQDTQVVNAGPFVESLLLRLLP